VTLKLEDAMTQAARRVAARLDFASISAAAPRELPTLLARWLPDGRAEGREWTARNPRRADRRPGSFRVNLRTGRWADFATARAVTTEDGGSAITGKPLERGQA
jgi:hypothetical protein